jgi:O-antigen/teichoic acid export membrane protein
MEMNSPTEPGVRWVKNIGSMAVIQLCGYLLPLATFPIVVRVLGPEIYGKWVYAQTVVGLFGFLANPGLKNYGLRQVAAQREGAGELILHLLSLNLVLGAITYGILAASMLVFQADGSNRQLILLFGITIFLNALFNLDWVFSGFQRFDRMAVWHLVSQGVFAGGIIFLLRRPEKVWILPILASCGILLAGLWGWRWMSREGIRFRVRFCPGKWWQILRVSFFYGLASAMAWVFQRGDHLMLAWIKGDAALGEYAASYRVMGALMGFVLIGTSVFVPYAAAVSTQGPEKFGPILRKGLLMLTSISIPIAVGAAFLGNEIATLVIGSAYPGSGLIFQALTVVIPLGVFSSFFVNSLLFAPGHHRQYAVTVTLAAGVNMLFNVLLIPPWGAFGAAVATAAAHLTLIVVAARLGRRYLEKVFSRALWHPFGASAAMVLALAILGHLGVHIFIRFVLGGATYVIFLWALDRRAGRELSTLLIPKRGPGSAQTANL